MDNLRILFIIGVCLICTLGLFGQNSPNPNLSQATISGIIIEEKSKQAVEYATIAIYKQENRELLTGTVSNPSGHFTLDKIPNGQYYLNIQFIGFNDCIVEDVIVSDSHQKIELGNISLSINAETLSEVVISSEDKSVEYQIDKKVINVADQLTSASETAVEILENIPSIRVDIEGNVSLRGSTGFTVLIDGKPTVLDPSDVLRQTPASTIQNIEVITNTSVKYEPDGTGGIINIITKKNRARGIQGLVNLNADRFGGYGGDFLLNYRKNKINFFIAGEYGDNPYEGDQFSERRTRINDTTTTIISDGRTKRQREDNNIRTGIDWDIAPTDNITIEMQAGRYSRKYESMLNYSTSRSFQEEVLREISKNNYGRSSDYFSANATYTHKFDDLGHQLAFQTNFNTRNGDEYSQNFNSSLENRINNGTKTTEVGPGWRINSRFDYTKPLNENDLIEAGIQIRNSRGIDETTLSLYDTARNEFILQPNFSNYVEYNRDIYAVYGIYRVNFNRLGCQFGLRGEYTYREITARKESGRFIIDRWDYFPTTHFSYQLPNDQQLMLSYSRRIDRPYGWYLEPFISWIDMYNVREGNPSLRPEYIDAMELGYIKNWNKAQFSLETYYRVKNNKIERIRSVYDDGVVLNTYENVGKDYSLGAEVMYSTPLWPWWEINITGDMFRYEIKGSRNNQVYDMNSFTWSGRWANTFSISDNYRFQLDAAYNSPLISSQGESSSYYSVNCALNANFLDKQLSATLQVRDVLASVRRERITEASNLYNLQRNTSDAPIVSLTISYRINNFMAERNLVNSNNNDDL